MGGGVGWGGGGGGGGGRLGWGGGGAVHHLHPPVDDVEDHLVGGLTLWARLRDAREEEIGSPSILFVVVCVRLQLFNLFF